MGSQIVGLASSFMWGSSAHRNKWLALVLVLCAGVGCGEPAITSQHLVGDMDCEQQLMYDFMIVESYPLPERMLRQGDAQAASIYMARAMGWEQEVWLVNPARRHQFKPGDYVVKTGCLDSLEGRILTIPQVRAFEQRDTNAVVIYNDFGIPVCPDPPPLSWREMIWRFGR